MTLSDADYAALKIRLAKDTITVGVLHVIGDLDCNTIKPRKAIRLTNGSHLYSGKGVPNVALGVNTDYYFREDPVGSTHLYFKSAGTWSPIV
jgi:hypothetical protein